jgi:hypothetical protein
LERYMLNQSKKSRNYPNNLSGFEMKILKNLASKARSS